METHTQIVIIGGGIAGLSLLYHLTREGLTDCLLLERDEAYIQSVLERSDCFQGRIASREQVQVQIDFPQHREWVDIFRGWWKDGMRMWRQRNPDDATLVFLCELGPPPYAITDARQNELSDRWLESLKIRDWVHDIWAELDVEMS